MVEPTLADFLQRVLVWPDPSSPEGWVNVHWRGHGKKGITGGQATKTLEETHNVIGWTQTNKGRQYVDDVYFCTSLQRDHGDLKPSGKWGVLRSIDNAISSRVLYADVDKYPNKVEGLAAIKGICERTNSPYPTAIVDSGGGLHAYWSLPEPFPKEAWLKLAAHFVAWINAGGLKCDPISMDMARILRPPGTLNYKQETPRPVVLKLPSTWTTGSRST